jgi:arginase
LLNIGLNGAQLSAAHTVVLGPRSYEPEEMVFLREQGVRIIERDEILSRGFAACAREAVSIASSAPGGFGVTLDLDALDPRLAPGVGSPEPDGLGSAEVRAALRRASGMAGLRALEIVEYNPDRDRHGMTAALISELIAEILPEAGCHGEK